MWGTHHHSGVLHSDAGGGGSQGSTDAVVVFKADFYLRCKLIVEKNSNSNTETSDLGISWGHSPCHLSENPTHNHLNGSFFSNERQQIDHTISCASVESNNDSVRHTKK